MTTLFFKKNGSKLKIAGVSLFALLMFFNIRLSLDHKSITNKSIDLLGVQMSVQQVSAYDEGPMVLKILPGGGYYFDCACQDQTICVPYYP